MVGISFVGIVLTTSTLLVADGPFIRYLMLPMLGLAVVVWLSIAATVVEIVGSRESFVRGSMIVALALTALVGTLSGFAVSGDHLARSYSNGFIDSMVADIRRNCDELPERAVIDVDPSVSWADAVSMVNQIDRCTETRATEAVGFISGQGFPADPADEVNVRIGTVSSLSGYSGVDIAAFEDVVVRVSD